MPDHDSTLTRALGDIAEAGRQAARPVSAGHIRRLARSRARRRRSALGAVTAVAVAGTSWGVLSNGPQPVTEADGGPRATSATTGTAGTADLEPAEFGPATLLTEEDVASSLGTMWSWTAGAVEEPSGKLTPCQADAAADPDRSGALSRVVTGGWSGDDTLTEWVEQTSGDEAATSAFDRAVGWFTDCGGQGVDQSGVKGSLTKRFEAVGNLPGVDEQRVVVRMREHLGTDTWTDTVAGVLRVGDLVAVVAWDVTIDDNPGAYDDGFVDLMRAAAGRLTNVAAPRVDPQAHLQPDDEAVIAVVGAGATASEHSDRQIRLNGLLCEQGAPYTPESLVTGRRVDLVAPDTMTAGIFQTTYVFESVDAATTAVRESKVTPSTCSDSSASVGEVSPVEFSGGDESYLLRRDPAPDRGPAERSFVAVVRVGASVSVVSVREMNGPVTERSVLDLLGKVTSRLQEAAGG